MRKSNGTFDPVRSIVLLKYASLWVHLPSKLSRLIKCLMRPFEVIRIFKPIHRGTEIRQDLTVFLMQDRARLDT